LFFIELAKTKTKSTATTAKRLAPVLRKCKNITLSASSLEKDLNALIIE